MEAGQYGRRSSLIDLYGAWHAAEAGKGYANKAAEWRAKHAEGPEAKANEDRAGTNPEGAEGGRTGVAAAATDSPVLPIGWVSVTIAVDS